MQVLAIDPGREKCGVALARLDSGSESGSGSGSESGSESGSDGAVQVLELAIWPRAQFLERLSELLERHAIQAFVLGDATSSRELQAELARGHAGIPIHVVDERNSTLEARPLYWAAHPPRGWRRMVPLSLQTPPRAIDDFAAQVLAIRFSQSQRET